MEGRRDWLRDHAVDQSGPKGLPRTFALSGWPQPKGWVSVEGRGNLSNEYTEDGRGDDEPLREAPKYEASVESGLAPNGSYPTVDGLPKLAGLSLDEDEKILGSMRRLDAALVNPSLSSLENVRGNRFDIPLAQFPWLNLRLR